jgi:hypothetical protein
MGFPCEEEFKEKLGTVEYLTLDEVLCESVWKRFPRPLKIIVKALQHFNSVAPYRSIRYRVSKNHPQISINTSKSSFEAEFREGLLVIEFTRQRAGGETVVEKAEAVVDEGFAREVIDFIADHIKYVKNTPPIAIPTKIVKYFLS